MKKIPLETTLVGAYRFLFTNIVSVIGTIWLPFVLLFGLMGGLVYMVIPHEWLTGNFTQFDAKEVLTKALPLLYCYPLIIFAALVTAAMVLVGLLRHSLGLKRGTTFIYFSLGAKVWRLIGAYLLIYVVMVALVAIFAVAFGLLDGVFAPMMPKAAAVFANVVLGFIAFCAVFYVLVRLFFFLPAVIVAEGKLGIRRAWSLGGGNFWRIFFTILMIVIPVGFLAGIALEMTILPACMAAALTMPHHPAAADVAAMFRSLLPLLPTILIIVLIERIAIMGLLAGAMGTAYNALTTPAAPAAPAAEAVSPAEVAASA